jgi:uncharacterized protein
MTLASWLADRMILCPTRQPIEAEGQTARFIKTRYGEVQIFTRRLMRVAGAKQPTLRFLKLPGTGGRAERSTIFPAHFAPNIASEVVAWNPPGYGNSGGRAHLSDLVPAATDVYDQLQGELDIPTVAVGNSLGCCVALGLAIQRPLAGLILRNVPPLRELCRLRDRWWNAWQGGSLVASGVPDTLDAMQLAPQVTVPAVFLQSQLDQVVPLPLQQLVAAKFAGPKQQVILENSDHGTPLDDSHLAAIHPAILWLLATS